MKFARSNQARIIADSFEMLDPKVTVIDADSAFITGRSVIKNGKYTVPDQKKPIDITGEYRFLDVYAKRDGKWQVVASQAVRRSCGLQHESKPGSVIASPRLSFTVSKDQPTSKASPWSAAPDAASIDNA